MQGTKSIFLLEIMCTHLRGGAGSAVVGARYHLPWAWRDRRRMAGLQHDGPSHRLPRVAIRALQKIVSHRVPLIESGIQARGYTRRSFSTGFQSPFRKPLLATGGWHLACRGARTHCRPHVARVCDSVDYRSKVLFLLSISFPSFQRLLLPRPRARMHWLRR